MEMGLFAGHYAGQGPSVHYKCDLCVLACNIVEKPNQIMFECLNILLFEYLNTCSACSWARGDAQLNQPIHLSSQSRPQPKPV
jgi:hypothetical protein